jgi:toxin ParE1/3/4
MTASRLTIAPAAERDLDEAWLHIASDDQPAADRFVDRILSTCRKIADVPGMGPTRPDLAPNLRYFPIAGYLSFGRPIGGGIEVVRVLHGARDLLTVLRSED